MRAACLVLLVSCATETRIGGLTSGKRLVVQAVSDGENVLPFGLYDRELGEVCRPRRGGDGVMRCEPAFPRVVLYADPGCTERIALVEQALIPTHFARQADTYYELGAERSWPGNVYFGGDGSCSWNGYREQPVFDVGAPVDPRRFVTFRSEPDPDASAPGLTTQRLVSEDGAIVSSRAPTGIGYRTSSSEERDGLTFVDGVECAAVRLVDEAVHCVPGEKPSYFTPVWQRVDLHYSTSAACDAPVRSTWQPGERETHVLDFVHDVCLQQWTPYALGDRIDPAYAAWSDGCQARGGPVFAVGDPLPPDAFPLFFVDRFPRHGRLSIRTAVRGTVNRTLHERFTRSPRYPQTLHDDALGIDCGLVEEGATLRCAPVGRPTYYAPVFDDAACAVPAFLINYTDDSCRQPGFALHGDTYYETGEEVGAPLSPLWMLSYDGRCEPSTLSGSKQVLFTVKRAIAKDELALLSPLAR